MTTLTFRQPAPKGSRFVHGCFDSWLGSRVPFRVMDRWVGGCLIVSAQVAEDGSAVTLVVDVPEEAAPQAPMPPCPLKLLD